MTPREVVRTALEHRRPPYVPWQLGFTHEAASTLAAHYGVDKPALQLRNHFLSLDSGLGSYEAVGDSCYRDRFGVVWDRSIDKDIGVVKGSVLPQPSLADYAFPEPDAEALSRRLAQQIEQHADRFRVFSIGFTLFERAWTMRGMQNLMIDFMERPDFVNELLDALVELNIRFVRVALACDIDCVHFGDDWGQQHGLLMGPRVWREFFRPRLARMYAVVKAAGKYVSIHSCGDVDELFDDLVDIGLDLFNPFQPEVMDVFALKRAYAGRLAFHGGLSTQRTLPYGTPRQVREETQRLLECGRQGGYVFAPAHAVEGDVPLQNMLAFIEVLHSQPGFQAA